MPDSGDTPLSLSLRRIGPELTAWVDEGSPSNLLVISGLATVVIVSGGGLGLMDITGSA